LTKRAAIGKDRLTSATIGGATSSYTYNADGLRSSRTVGGSTAYDTFSWGTGLPVLLKSGGTNYYYDSLAVRMMTNGTTPTTYYQADGLCSIVTVTDAAGNPGTS
jgi:YD repeat-containing protein